MLYLQQDEPMLFSKRTNLLIPFTFRGVFRQRFRMHICSMGNRSYWRKWHYRFCNEWTVHRCFNFMWIEKKSCFEFNSIYCFNLRGDQRTQRWTFPVKKGKDFWFGFENSCGHNDSLKKKGVKKTDLLRYYDIGDYLTRQQKLWQSQKSLIMWAKSDGKIITPDINGDWVNLRNPQYMNFFFHWRKDEKKVKLAISPITFQLVWLRVVMHGYIALITNQKQRWKHDKLFQSRAAKMRAIVWKKYLEKTSCQKSKGKRGIFENNRSVDSHKISWSRGLLNAFCKGEPLSYKGSRKIVMHRPFCKEWCLLLLKWLSLSFKVGNIFPEEGFDQIMLLQFQVNQTAFSALITSVIQDYDMEQHANAFPLYIYEKETIKRWWTAIFVWRIRKSVQ